MVKKYLDMHMPLNKNEICSEMYMINADDVLSKETVTDSAVMR
jgi:hypothetical protein